MHAVDDPERVLAVAHDHDAAHRFAVAVQLAESPRRMSGPKATVPTSATRIGVPVRAVGAERDLTQVVEVVDVAAAAHEVLAARHLDHASADVRVAAPDRRR